jgi:hypothetical protein
MLIAAAFLAVSGIGVLAGSAGAQTGAGDLAAFCASRIEANSTEGKAASLAVMDKMVTAAPATVVQQMTGLRDAYKKKGDKLFDSEAGLELLVPLDAWVYDNCPGTSVPVTAIDYEYQGVPASLKAGVTKFKMTNAAPKEAHMMAIVKLTPAAQGQDVSKLLALPEKKSRKYFDESSSAFMEAGPGQVGYAPINLQPGTYAYVCFLPVGGKDSGAPHMTKGMYGSFTVS